MNSSKYFTKLNLDFSDVQLADLKLTFSYGFTDVNSDEKNYKVYRTEEEFQDYIKSKLPESFRSWIRRVRLIVAESPGILPHRDNQLEACINFYLTTGDASTTYWSPKPDANPIPHPKHPNEPTANIYYINDLVEKCSAIFEENSCYLLNVSQIHSVDIEKDCVRKVIQLTFDPDITYNMVLAKLTELNLIEETK